MAKRDRMTHSSGDTNSSDSAPTSPAETRREPVHFERERGVTEIRVQRNVSHVTVQIADSDIGSGRLRVLQTLAASSVPLFLVKLLPAGLSFAIRGENSDACRSSLSEIGVSYTFIEDLSVVTTIAGAMRDLSGIMASIYEELNDAGIRVQQTGDAYNAVLCLVSGPLSEKAAQALRKRFSLTEGVSGANSGYDAEPASGIEVPGTGLKAL